MSRKNTGLNISGVYKFICIVNNKVYIGSSKQLRNRKNRHFQQLKNGEHHSSLLQKDYNRFGKDSFQFKVIEVVNDISQLHIREQYYLDNCNPFYNICKSAESTKGFNHTDDTKELMSKAHIGIKKDPEVIKRVVQTRMSKITEEERIERRKIRILKKRTNYNIKRRFDRQQIRLDKLNQLLQ